MRRLRLALLAVAVGLGVPVAVLAWRALEGLALERAVRHQALAERAFDEMERVLSSWLEREEARPFEHYRFYVSAPDERSPLSGPPRDRFVVGAFQVDPDGSVHTPMQPRDPAAAAARGDWPPAPEVERAIAQVKRLVQESWKPGAPAPGAEPGRKADSGSMRRADIEPGKRQDPGTTRPLGGPLADRKDRAAQDLDDAADTSASAYDLLQRLNTGADARAARRQKIAEAKLPGSAPEPALSAPSTPRQSEESSPAPPSAAEVVAEVAKEVGREEVAVDEREVGQLRALGYLVSESLPSDRLAGGAVGRVEPRTRDVAPGAVRVALDPMVGRDAGDGYLLLYRTVLVGELGYRQGLVLDRAELGRWLAARALEPSGLSRVATLRFDADGPPRGGGFVFQHRFAEPFDVITARLSLSALPGVGSPGAVYALVGLLALVGAAGLFAIHRMVGVRVDFAERRNSFVSAVTHELRTPLTAIRMYAEMLRDGLVPSEAKKGEYYRTITDESERLSRLIDNVLEFSRLERGAREMSFCVGSVDPVLREAAGKLSAHAAREGFRLELEIEPELPPVRYDRDALLQVIFNLVDNAMKYGASAAARRVVLEARRREGGVELAVRDFGPGVPGRHLSRIFEPFYRGEDELTRSARGSGIGLALVCDLAERMGAAVRGGNAPGGGFRVCLAFEVAAPS